MIQQPKFIRFIYKAPVAIAGLFGILYATQLVVRFNDDTSAITNGAFAVMATLAALSFSFARAAEEELRDRITFAGERLLHGAILVLIVSIIKHFIYIIYQTQELQETNWAVPLLQYFVGPILFVVFFNGVLFAHTGLKVLNDLLLMRFTRQRDWDDIF